MTIEYAEIHKQYGKNKTFLNVTAVFEKNGSLIPLSFYWEDQVIKIKRILNIMPMTEIDGTVGKRYTCLAGSKQFYLYFDSIRWFLFPCLLIRIPYIPFFITLIKYSTFDLIFSVPTLILEYTYFRRM